jgi:hypothetical protein
LIATLETTKAKAGEIAIKLNIAQETSVEIDTVCILVIATKSINLFSLYSLYDFM